MKDFLTTEEKETLEFLVEEQTKINQDHGFNFGGKAAQIHIDIVKEKLRSHDKRVLAKVVEELVKELTTPTVMEDTLISTDKITYEGIKHRAEKFLTSLQEEAKPFVIETIGDAKKVVDALKKQLPEGEELHLIVPQELLECTCSQEGTKTCIKHNMHTRPLQGE